MENYFRLLCLTDRRQVSDRDPSETFSCSQSFILDTLHIYRSALLWFTIRTEYLPCERIIEEHSVQIENTCVSLRRHHTSSFRLPISEVATN